MKKQSALKSVMPSQSEAARESRGNARRLRRAFLSIGSNLGDSSAMIAAALGRLSETGVKVVRVSSFYKTQPVDFHQQPWFINCAAEVVTSRSPRQLLRVCLSVERVLGRRRTQPKGPRLIDIDILLYENIVVRRPGLTIPHPRMTERRFALVPLRELAPRLVHPLRGETISALLRRTADKSKVIRMRGRARACSTFVLH